MTRLNLCSRRRALLRLRLSALHATSLVVTFAALVLSASLARASVVVIANRMQEPLRLDASLDGKPPQAIELAPGDSRPLFAYKSALVRVLAGGVVKQFPLQPDGAYYIGLDPNTGAATLQPIGLGEAGPRPWPAADRPPLEFPGAEMIPVKIFVDDDEPRQRSAWEATIRARVEEASKALLAHAGVGLRIVGVGTWDSDDAEHDFFRSLAEFERETIVAPAKLAIGFSSQYEVNRGRFHLGGTRGPLSSHILIKERASSVLEPERLEALTHEAGHVLGAAHSPEATSVMRPVVGQGLQRRAGARLQFDPVNTLIMSMIGEQIRQRRVEDLSDVPPTTRRRLAQIYSSLEDTIPDDPAAAQYLKLLQMADSRPLVDETRRILVHLTRVAKIQARLREEDRDRLFEATSTEADDGKSTSAKAPDATLRPLEGDALCELFVEQAAVIAGQKPGPHSGRAMIIALGMGLDDAGALSRVAGDLVARVEGVSQRAERMAALGAPTMRDDETLRRQFFASSCVVALSGSAAARNDETIRALLGVDVGEPIPLAPLAANRAGQAFAHAVLGGRIAVKDLGRVFRTTDVMPPVAELVWTLGLDDAAESGIRFADLPTVIAKLDAYLAALPAYQPR